MGQQLINVGAEANDRTGDTWRDAMIKTNGNFTDLFTLLDSITITFIDQESAFPTQDATTITLEADIVYILTESFTTAKRFICENGSKITSFNQLGLTLTYTGAGAMFTGFDADFTVSDVRVNCASSLIFDFDESVGGQKLLIVRFFTAISCAKFGSFGSLQAVVIENSSCTQANDGITFTGTQANALFTKFALITQTTLFTGIDFGSALGTNITLSSVILQGPAGAVGIAGLTASGNVPAGFSASVTVSEFTGGLTPLTGITPSDIRWLFVGNVGVQDSRNDADAYLIGGSETITTGAAGDWQEIGVPVAVGVSWASDISERFTVGTDGVITYDGQLAIDVRITGRATVAKVGGGSDVIEVRFAKNWDGTASDSGLEKSRAQTENPTPTTVPVGALIALVTGDNLRLIFSNTTGTSNIIASVSAMEVTD
jgi:hypothetical protein